ncbi:MAG: hypothetical protein AAGF12_07245 [Myxococcota bacterium]
MADAASDASSDVVVDRDSEAPNDCTDRTRPCNITFEACWNGPGATCTRPESDRCPVQAAVWAGIWDLNRVEEGMFRIASASLGSVTLESSRTIEAPIEFDAYFSPDDIVQVENTDYGEVWQSTRSTLVRASRPSGGAVPDGLVERRGPVPLPDGSLLRTKTPTCAYVAPTMGNGPLVQRHGPFDFIAPDGTEQTIPAGEPATVGEWEVVGMSYEQDVIDGADPIILRMVAVAVTTTR